MKNGTFIYIETKDKSRELTRQEIVNRVRKIISQLEKKPIYRDDYMEGFKQKESLLKVKPEEPWIFSPAREIKDELLALENCVKLGQLCDVTQGVTIGGEGCLEIFFIKDKKVKINNKTVTLESDPIAPILGGNNVRRWHIDWNGEMLIYPYQHNGTPMEFGNFDVNSNPSQVKKDLNKLIAMGVVKYPNVAKYLVQFFQKLAKREFEGKPLSAYGKKWFELHRPREPKKLQAKPKIVCPRMMEINRFALDERGFLILDSCMAIVPKRKGNKITKLIRKISKALEIDDYSESRLALLKYLLGILNSPITELLMKLSVPFLQNRYYQVSESFLSSIPIMIPKELLLIRKVVLTVEDCIKGKNVDDKLNQIIYELYHMDKKNRRAKIEAYISTH